VPLPAAILDIDGTLVDTNYHHALSWWHALRQHDVHVPIWRIHRHIGMGGDQLVPTLAGEAFDAEHGDEVRAAETALYMATIDAVRVLPGGPELIRALKDAGHTVVLASSAKPQELERYLDLLDARDVVDAWTTSADVEATKPEPDLIEVAVEKAGGGPAVMVGDSTWDMEAAGRAGVPAIGVLSGGFGEGELREAGAELVLSGPDELRERRAETALARAAAPR
jgi:HAD superfamily hydrolase (TIGR01549 family)